MQKHSPLLNNQSTSPATVGCPAAARKASRAFLDGFLVPQVVCFKYVDSGGGFRGEGRSLSKRLDPVMEQPDLAASTELPRPQLRSATWCRYGGMVRGERWLWSVRAAGGVGYAGTV